MKIRFNRQKWKDVGHLIVRGIKHLILHNGWIKLLAVVISVVLWAGLISQDPTVSRNKTFQNVSVEIQGQEELKNKGRIVTNDLDKLLADVEVSVLVPQLQYENADASAYNLHVDLSTIKSFGEQEVRILSDPHPEYGYVTSINPSTITVNVEEYYTNPNVQVKLETTGQVPEGWYNIRNTVQPTSVIVSGPISLVKEVNTGIVTLDLSTLSTEEGTIPISGEVKLYNLNMEEIKNPNLTIRSQGNNSDRVLVRSEMYKLKDLQNINVVIQGQEELKNRGRIVVSDLEELLSGVKVKVAVPQQQFDKADSSRYTLRVNLNKITSTGEQEVTIEKSSVENGYGEIISIEPEKITVNVEEYFTNPKVPITVQTTGELPDGWYNVQRTLQPQTVVVSGPISLVKEVSRGIVTLDLSTMQMEEGTIPIIGEIKLYNLKREEISNPQITIRSEGNYNDSVIVQALMYPTREYSVREMVQVRGVLADGYTIVDEPVFSPEYITIAASEEYLKILDSMTAAARADVLLESGVLDISGMKESNVVSLKVNSLTIDRDNMVNVRPAGGTPIRVTINIEEIPKDPVKPEPEESAPEGNTPGETGPENPEETPQT